LAAAFAEVAASNGTRVVILTGGGGHFCAGNDISATAAMSADPTFMEQRAAAVESCFRNLRTLRVPAIAAMQGACVGGGCTLASYCDFRVADSTARIGITVANQSLGYPTPHLIRLISVIGLAAARHWIYSGGLIDADSAAQVGFVDYIAQHDAMETAQRIAQPILDKAPLSIAVSRAQFDAIASQQLATSLDEIDMLMNKASASKDREEAVAAFLEKRRPQFFGH
jgi:enoyl-CoA hydratase/carnithine racemase